MYNVMFFLFLALFLVFILLLVHSRWLINIVEGNELICRKDFGQIIPKYFFSNTNICKILYEDKNLKA